MLALQNHQIRRRDEFGLGCALVGVIEQPTLRQSKQQANIREGGCAPIDGSKFDTATVICCASQCQQLCQAVDESGHCEDDRHRQSQASIAGSDGDRRAESGARHGAKREQKRKPPVDVAQKGVGERPRYGEDAHAGE